MEKNYLLALARVAGLIATAGNENAAVLKCAQVRPPAAGLGPESGRSRGLRRGKWSAGPAGLKKLRKSHALCLIAVLAVSAVGHAAVVLDPLSWGLQPGDTFRVAIVTYGQTAATSTDISTYDGFVNGQNLNLITYNGLSLTWQAIGQTSGSLAMTDSSRYSSQANATRIYNLAGQLVSNGHFWSSPSSPHTANIDQSINPSGNLQQVGGSTWVYTGFDYNGAVISRFDEQAGTDVYSYLGQTATYMAANRGDPSGALVSQTLGVSYGRAGATASGWADAGEQTSLGTQYAMYGLSALVTVTAVPEPINVALGVFGAVFTGVAVVRRRRARKLSVAPSQ